MVHVSGLVFDRWSGRPARDHEEKPGRKRLSSVNDASDQSALP
jgi:hypothetical protein